MMASKFKLRLKRQRRRQRARLRAVEPAKPNQLGVQVLQTIDRHLGRLFEKRSPRDVLVRTLVSRN